MGTALAAVLVLLTHKWPPRKVIDAEYTVKEVPSLED